MAATPNNGRHTEPEIRKHLPNAPYFFNPRSISSRIPSDANLRKNPRPAGRRHIRLAPCCRYLVIFTVARGGVSAKTL
jgi:hypothetical protein